MLAADTYKKFMPMLMTAAGTVKAAKVIILGAGVAGLQAIATAKRLGAVVEASDVRPAVKEQIESLGGKFIDVPFETDEEKEAAEGQGGYAKAMPQSWLKRQSELVAQKAIAADIIITSALIPGREPPVLISEEVVKNMKPGSVILDMAAGMAKNGSGNCPLTKANEIIEKNGITIIGKTNLPSMVSADASSLYARNIFEFIKLLFNEKKELHINKEDELVDGCLMKGDK
jgi:NAD(P) transhydrogenase subunit alpha